MDTTNELMNTLRAGRALAGMSQTDLAAAAGVSRQIVARIENGESNISAGSISAVRAALERAGIVFIPSTPKRGPGVAQSRPSDH